MKTLRIRWMAIAAGAFPLAALVFLVNPALILIGAPAFSMALSTWLLLGAAAAISGLVLTLPALVPTDRLFSWVTVLYKSLFLVLFLITVFYPEGGRRLDGVEAEAVSTTYLALVYVVYAALAVAFWFVFTYRKEIANSLYYVSLASCSLVILYQLSSNPPAWQSRTETSVDLEYATDSNVIIILADMLQGSTVEQLFQLGPNLTKEFSGFTAYTRAISPFPFTSYGLPAILSGKLYAAPPEKGYLTNFDAVRHDSLLTSAEEHGYKTVIMSWSELPISDGQYNYATPRFPVYTAALLIDLGMTRLTKLPNLLGDFSQMNRAVIALKRESLQLLEEMTEAGVGKQPRKLIFHHNFIPHSPNYYGLENLSIPKFDWRPMPFDVESYLEETSFFFEKLVNLLNHMKKLGIYNNSLVIVLGDHGHFAGEKRELYNHAPGASDFHGWEAGGWARAACMYNAAMLVKPPFNKQSLRIRHDPLSLVDVRGFLESYFQIGPLDFHSQILTKPADRMNEVVVFRENAKDPYKFADDHVVFRFRGNASNLAQSFVERSTPLGPYTQGKPLAPANDLMDGNWTKEGTGAWLMDRPGRIHFVPIGFQKGPYELAVTATPLGDQQRVDISVNGEPIGQLVFQKAKETLSISIPEDVISASADAVLIEFQALDAVSPAELGLWDTVIPISIYVHSIRIDSA